MENLISIKDHNSNKFSQITGKNPNLDLVNINAYTCKKIWQKSMISIFSQDIEQKRKTDINQGPLLE